MSRKSRKRISARPTPAPALVFAALGDETRLALVARLATGEPASIVELTAGAKISRQAVTKHLRVLERAGIVRSLRTGREKHFAFDPQPIETLQHYLHRVSLQWDEALDRLKRMVEH